MKLHPGLFTVAYVEALLATNDYVHVDEVKNEPNSHCDGCAAVVETLCQMSMTYCGRFLFFFRYPVGASVGPRVDLLELALAGKVKRIMFETYPGAKTCETWLCSDNIAVEGDIAFGHWAALYQPYGASVMPVVGIGNRVMGNGVNTTSPMNNCALDMMYLASMFDLIHRYGPWWAGVAVYGASEVVDHCSQYSVDTVIGNLHELMTWWPHGVAVNGV